MDGIARTIGAKLTAQKWRISVAESCTGGLVCKLITDVEGSSAWFDRGFISYTNESKMAMLNVARETLDKHGAVSLQTVEAMAYG
ncbi:MAG TPA: CinA family protein, partial [Gammaproteobacteria bacterium]|nr:CinA family protein [Gammaproteobacteria bacterium]